MKNRGGILSRLHALTFHLSPIPSPYEKIRGLCGGERCLYVSGTMTECLLSKGVDYERLKM